MFTPVSITRGSWIEGLMQRETMPVLEAGMAFAHQRQLTIGHNIANVNTPYYKRQALPDNRFRRALDDALREREDFHWNEFTPRSGMDLRWDQNYVQANRIPGHDRGPERHDENNVVIEHEMADLAKNTLYMQTLQTLYKKHTSQFKMALRDRIG